MQQAITWANDGQVYRWQYGVSSIYLRDLSIVYAYKGTANR